MAIVVPADWEHIDRGRLVGFVPAAIEPVNTLAQRSHWIYDKHSPAVLSAVVWNRSGSNHLWILPITPSADGLAYVCDLSIVYTANDTYIASLQYTNSASSSGATWAPVDTATSPALAAAPSYYSFRLSGTIPSTATYLRFRTYGGAHQAVHCLVYPAAGAPAATNPSGFVAFDDAFLTSGAPIHTEYLNRCVANANAVYTDRAWCVWSWCQDLALTYRLTGSITGATRTIGLAQVSMPDDMLTRTATVRVKADDSGGAAGHVEVFQVNGQTTGAALTADGTDRTATLELIGSRPIIGARAVANGSLRVFYITVDVVPATVAQGSGKALITSAAPPARSEYLTTIDGTQTRLYWQPYPVPGLNIDPELYPVQLCVIWMRIGPGIRRFRPAVTRYITGEGAASVVAPAIFAGLDGGTAPHEMIRIPTSQTGDSEVHPIAGATEEEETLVGAVEWGSMLDMPVPSGVAYPSGVDRLAEVSEDGEPQAGELIGIYFLFGLGGEFIASEDITDL